MISRWMIAVTRGTHRDREHQRQSSLRRPKEEPKTAVTHMTGGSWGEAKWQREAGSGKREAELQDYNKTQTEPTSVRSDIHWPEDWSRTFDCTVIPNGHSGQQAASSQQPAASPDTCTRGIGIHTSHIARLQPVKAKREIASKRPGWRYRIGQVAEKDQP
ncbi:hypothetical protein CHU98_g3881 [Xylaria longipes]|nr:hypothetical protein CHU98_g3881 [Xylaria longipes]